MENSYVEKLVTKKPDMKTMMVRVITVVISLLVIYLGFFYLGTLGMAVYGLVVLFFMAWLVWYVFSVTYVEYEFVLVKNELSIDGIYGKNKRKHLQTIDVSKCEVIAPRESTYVAGYDRNTQIKSFDYTSGTNEEPVFILITSYGAGTAKVYMEFDQKMIDGVKMAAPGKLKLS